MAFPLFRPNPFAFDVLLFWKQIKATDSMGLVKEKEYFGFFFFSCCFMIKGTNTGVGKKNWLFYPVGVSVSLMF